MLKFLMLLGKLVHIKQDNHSLERNSNLGLCFRGD